MGGAHQPKKGLRRPRAGDRCEARSGPFCPPFGRQQMLVDRQRGLDERIRERFQRFPRPRQPCDTPVELE